MNDRSIDLALKTWYPKDHPLHYDLHHPLGKLVAEWGEFLNDYMNDQYKPNYKWQPLDELVDIWYYIRILAYQTNIKLDFTLSLSFKLDYSIACAISEISTEFRELAKSSKHQGKRKHIPKSFILALNSNYSILYNICRDVGLTIDQLTEASWQKLKPGSERGDEWMKTRETATKTS